MAVSCGAVKINRLPGRSISLANPLKETCRSNGQLEKVPPGTMNEPDTGTGGEPRPWLARETSGAGGPSAARMRQAARGKPTLGGLLSIQDSMLFPCVISFHPFSVASNTDAWKSSEANQQYGERLDDCELP